MCVGLGLQGSSLLSTVSIALAWDKKSVLVEVRCSKVNEDSSSCGQEEGRGYGGGKNRERERGKGGERVHPIDPTA